MDDDETLLEGENEDDLASRLLVQFPAYGTRTQQNNNLNQTADWLLGGTSNIPNQHQLRKQQIMQAEDDSASLPPFLSKEKRDHGFFRMISNIEPN